MGKKVETFEDLDIWKRAIDLYVEVYEASKGPGFKFELGIRDQLIRATLSVSNNIAEGFEYENNLQFIRFLRYAKGSAGEVRSMLHAFHRTKQINDLTHQQLVERVLIISKSIKSFLKYLSEHRKKSPATNSDLTPNI
jgi:four helix bundle protein